MRASRWATESSRAGSSATRRRAIARIRKLHPDREGDLVRVRESLVRSALKNLDAKILASIGVTVEQVDDAVVIAAANDDLDKLVDALLRDEEE